MKKIYKNFLLLLSLVLVGVSVNAQGTWKVSGTEAAINASTAIETGITGLTLMHSDAATVLGKSDTGATPVTYNDITWDNLAMMQGSTNGMYYALRPTSNGTIDVSVKMGSAKKTFVLELTDACPNYNDLAALTTGTATGDLIIGTTTYFTTPTVFDTYTNASATWNGSAAIQSTGANVYMVMSFPVTANKTYVVGVLGSKLMLRGLNYKVVAGVSNVFADKGISFDGKTVLNSMNNNIEIYNVLGKLVGKSSTDFNMTDLPKGIYIVRAEGINGALKFTK